MTLGKGIEVNKMIEDNTAGIAALISANTRMALSNGTMVNSYEKFQIASGKAASIMEELRVASTKTYATFPQLTGIYQQMIGHTMSMGDSMGKTVNEISTNTIELSKILSNIGGAIGMEMQKVNEEARSIISGNASTDSLIAMMVFGSPGDANKAMKEAKERGTNGVKDMLMGVLESYKVLEGVKTYTRAQLELQDQISRSQELLAKPTYNALKDVYMELSVALKQNEKDFQAWGERLLSVGKFIVEYADDIAIIATATAGAGLATKALGLTFETAKASMLAFAISTEKTTLATNAMATSFTKAGLAMKSMIVANAPLLAITAAYTVYELLIGRVAEKEEQLAKIRGKSADDLNKLTTSQLVYNQALLEEEFIAQTKRVQDAKAKVANQGLFGKTELEQKSDKALESEAQGLLDELRFAKKQTNDILEARKNIQTVIEKTKEQDKNRAELQTKYATNKKLEEDITSNIKKNEEEVVKLNKERKEIVDYLLTQENNLKDINKNAPKDTEARKQVENSIALAKAGILDKDKQIALEKEKALKQQIIESKQADNLNEAAATRAKLELELKALTEGTYNSATYIVDQAKVDVRLAEEKLRHLTGQDNILRASVDLGHKKLALEKAIADQKEKQDEADRKALSFEKINKSMIWKNLDTESLSQLEEGLKITFQGNEEALKQIQKEVDKARKEIYKEPLILDIKFDGFDEVSNGIAEIGNSFQNMQKEAAKYNRILKDSQAKPEELKQAQENYASATISGYGNMIGALGNFYDADDERREKQQKMANLFYAANMARQVAQMASSAASTSLFVAQEAIKAESAAVTATMVAAQSSPWTGFATAAAMIALAASLGIMIGGKTKTSTTSDAFSAQKANTGTGTVLGDTEKQSESITKALETLKDFASPQYKTLQSMNKYLENISNSIGGVSSLLIQQGGFAFGQGATEFNTGYKNNLDWGNSSSGGALLLQPINSIISKIPVVGQINDMFGSIMGSVMGGLFGKTSVSQALKDSGITFADTLLTSAIKEFNGQSFQTIATTTSKKSWFGSSSSTSIQSYFEDLDSETERQFSLVLNNLYNTTLLAGEALDSAQSETAKSLENFIISIGKVSLKDKTGDEIQSTLESIFGSIGDNIAKTAFPLLTPFQKVGEGMFETLTRVATGMEEADYYISRLGNSFKEISYSEILNPQGNVGFEALRQSLENTEKALYPTNNGLLDIVENLNGTAEELYTVYSSLDELRDRIIFLGQDTQGLSSSMIYGAGNVEELQKGFNDFFENFLTDTEQMTYSYEQLQTQFNDLNIQMPTTFEGFKNLINGLDLTSQAGQELYGRLIGLSGSFSDLFNTINNESNIKSFFNSFKTENDILLIQANKLKMTLPSTFEELGLQFKKLSSDTLGLTNEELDYLASSKEYVENRNKELLQLEVEKTEAEKKLQDELLSNIKSNISSIENILDSLSSKIDELRASADLTNTYTLDKFKTSMSQTLDLMQGKNYEAIQESLQKTLGYSSALMDANNFALSRDMRYAQLVAANQFESMDITLQTEVDYLKMIEQNTAKTVDALTATLTALGTSISSSLDKNSTAFNDMLKGALGTSSPSNQLVKDIYSKYGIDKYQTDTSGYAYWEQQLTSGKISVTDLEQTIKTAAREKGMLSFAVGTTDVPYDMTANIHKGEIITPETYADGIRGGDLVMGRIGDITSSIERIGDVIASKIASLIIATNKQNKTLKDIYDVTNGSLASLQNIEEII